MAKSPCSQSLSFRIPDLFVLSLRRDDSRRATCPVQIHPACAQGMSVGWPIVAINKSIPFLV